MTLLDESGEIRVTCYNDAADKWYPFFSQGEMYVISQGKLKFANKKFTSVKHAYEMTLNADSMVIPIQGVETVPLIHFDIVPIDHLEDAKKDDMVDVCGVVISSKPVATITTKRGETAKRSILLGDSSGRTIELTLWGTHALEFDEVLASAPHPVLAVKGARVSDFGGKTLSAVQSSEFEVNPQVPAAFNAQNWFNSLPNQGRDVPSLSGGGSGGGGGGMGGGKEKTLGAIASENLGHNATPDYITVPNIYITSFKRDAATLWYKACSKPECKGRKVEERGVGNFACPTCGSVNSYKLRWVSNFTGFDHTGREWISGFGEAGSIILGCEPESIADLDRGEARFIQTFDDPRYRSYNMKLAVKSELWNDTPRIKVSVQSITPVNYVTDSTRLISRIQELTK
jgi:replication factor A1